MTTEKEITEAEYAAAKQTIERFLEANKEEKTQETIDFIVLNGERSVHEHEQIPGTNLLRVTKWRYTHKLGVVDEQIVYVDKPDSSSFLATRAAKRVLI